MDYKILKSTEKAHLIEKERFSFEWDENVVGFVATSIETGKTAHLQFDTDDFCLQFRVHEGAWNELTSEEVDSLRDHFTQDMLDLEKKVADFLLNDGARHALYLLNLSGVSLEDFIDYIS